LKIAISGKGGTGKTTLTALLAQTYADRGREVLAVDSDPSPSLAGALAFPDELLAKLQPIAKMEALIEERTGAKPGAAAGFFTLNPRVDDLPERFSAVHEGVRLLEMGSVVFDERPEFASAERFPGAALHVRPFEGGLRELRIGGNDAVVVITPEHKYDREVLGQALETDAGYIGMIGSKRKIKAIFDNLRAAGVSDERLAQVHSPIGLDIGAESPAEIALAIAAQIVDHFKRAG